MDQERSTCEVIWPMQKQLRIAAVGDLMLSGGYWEQVRKNETDDLFRNVAPLLDDADVAVGNLEGPLTERASAGPPWRFCLHGHPAYAQVLRKAGFGVLCLANNHMMDYGWEGVEESIQTLSEAGIHTFGAGVNLSMARNPLRLSLAGLRVAFLGYTDVPVNLPVFATESRPGVLAAEPQAMIEDIRSAKQGSDVVVVSLHWGHEMFPYPTTRQRKLARELISAGANVILGHHPHVLQGVEQVNEGIVAYSLGTYSVCEEEWVGQNSNGESFRLMHMGPNDGWRRQAVLNVALSGSGRVVAHGMTPTYIRPDMRVVGDPRRERIEELRRSSSALHQPFFSWRSRTAGLFARITDWMEHIDHGTPLWKMALRVRLRHFKWIAKVLSQERQQLRGLK